MSLDVAMREYEDYRNRVFNRFSFCSRELVKALDDLIERVAQLAELVAMFPPPNDPAGTLELRAARATMRRLVRGVPLFAAWGRLCQFAGVVSAPARTDVAPTRRISDTLA